MGEADFFALAQRRHHWHSQDAAEARFAPNMAKGWLRSFGSVSCQRSIIWTMLLISPAADAASSMSAEVAEDTDSSLRPGDALMVSIVGVLLLFCVLFTV